MLPKTVFVLILMTWTQLELTVNCQEDEPAESYVTCDFDLGVQIPYIQGKILGRLPLKCQEIATGDGNQYQQMLAESLIFEEFTRELDNKEIEEDPNHGDEDSDIPIKQWQLRNDIYTKADLHECSNNKTANEFIDCLIHQRRLMIDEIINVT